MPEGWGQSARRACRFPASERLLLTYSRNVIWNSIVIPVSHLRYRPFEIRRVSRLTAPIFGIQCTTSPVGINRLDPIKPRYEVEVSALCRSATRMAAVQTLGERHPIGNDPDQLLIGV